MKNTITIATIISVAGLLFMIIGCGMFGLKESFPITSHSIAAITFISILLLAVKLDRKSLD